MPSLTPFLIALLMAQAAPEANRDLSECPCDCTFAPVHTDQGSYVNRCVAMMCASQTEGDLETGCAESETSIAIGSQNDACRDLLSASYGQDLADSEMRRRGLERFVSEVCSAEPPGEDAGPSEDAGADVGLDEDAGPRQDSGVADVGPTAPDGGADAAPIGRGETPEEDDEGCSATGSAGAPAAPLGALGLIMLIIGARRRATS